MSGWKGAFLAVIGVVIAVSVIGDHANADDFYAFTPAEIAGDPGDVVRSKQLTKPTLNGIGFKILYRTVGLKQKPTIASGLVFFPVGEPSTGESAKPRKIVVWAHATTGIVPRCAPSRLSKDPYEFWPIPGLETFLKDGYVVVAPDYVGLGAFPSGAEHTTIHPYLNSEVEATSIRDALRSATALAVEQTTQGTVTDVTLGKDIALFGHSQGGQAALAAASLLSGNDSEFSVKSLVVSAPPGKLAGLVPLQRTLVGQILTAYIVKAMEAENPSLDPDDFLVKSMLDVKDNLAKRCSVTEGEDQLAELEKAGFGGDPDKDYNGSHLKGPYLPSNWSEALRLRDPALLQAPTDSIKYPVLVTQGGADPLVPYRATRADVVKPLCNSTDHNALLGIFPNSGHNQQFNGSQDTSIAFIRSTLGKRPDLWPKPDPVPPQDVFYEDLAAFGFLVNCLAP